MLFPPPLMAPQLIPLAAALERFSCHFLLLPHLAPLLLSSGVASTV